MFKFPGKEHDGVQPDEVKPTDELKTEKIRGAFGMYTEAGNKAVEEIIKVAKTKGFRYQLDNEGQKVARSYLRSLATKEGFEEARDKEVEVIVFQGLRRNTK